MATTEQVGSSVEQIPFVALEALGRIFHEGEKKYGIGNWKDNPTPEYRVERLRHAIRHLFLFAEGDVTEQHLAKVLWFCVTEINCESQYGPLRDADIRERYPNAKHKPVDAEAPPTDKMRDAMKYADELWKQGNVGSCRSFGSTVKLESMVDIQTALANGYSIHGTVDLSTLEAVPPSKYRKG